MEFGEYYRRHFRNDFERFMQSISSECLYHNHADDVPLIQPWYLQRRKVYLRAIPSESRAHFAVSLFFTILVDQVCYTHYQHAYRQFQSLTRYPKLVGDCPGGCGCHRHPKDVFMIISSTFGQTIENNPADDAIYSSFEQSLEVMRGEVHDFFTKHMPAINPSAFWQRCADELPSKSMRNNLKK